MARILRWFTSPMEQRSASQVEADAREECELHLSLLREELEGKGFAAEKIEDLARARFGDADEYVRRCCAAALKERHMMQRLTFLAVVIIAVGAIGSFLVARRARSDMTTAMEQLAAKVDLLDMRRGSAGNPHETVYIVGNVPRPGIYSLPQGGVSVRRMLIGAGADPTTLTRVRILCDGPGGSIVRQELLATELVTTGPDPFVIRNDIIEAK